ncbi:MAG TPA: phosphotransferase, partial [Phenylobacterium sp.]|nr:phosphotransferase [Phenylobacterium sp.]
MRGETFPRTVEAITPQWLTGALRGCGALDGAAVSAFEASPLGAGAGFMSAMGRLALTYDGPAPGAPRSLIAKLAPLHPGARDIDQAFHFYEKETGFYRMVAPSTPVRTPRAYHVEFEPETHDFVLLLEDLAPARLGDQVDGLTAEDAALAVTAAGRLHARWWRDPELDDFDWLLPINSPQMRALQPIYQQCWPAVVDFLGERMPAAMKRTGERLATGIEAMLDQVAERPRTVVHGDFRADNMFFQVGESAEP